MAAKHREQRLVKLTLTEMVDLSDDDVVYEGVGKMYVYLLTYPTRLLYPWFTEPPLLLPPPLPQLYESRLDVCLLVSITDATNLITYVDLNHW